MLQIRLLGQFDVHLDKKRITIPSRVGQSLFAYLALTAGTPHRREKLAGTFWPDISDETARKYLRQELWRIRKVISAQQNGAEDYLLADEYTIAFSRNSDFWLDVAQVEKPDSDLESLSRNLSFYQGELLPGFYEDWIVLERERIQSIFDAKMGQLLDQLTATEHWTAVQEQAERWLTLGNTPEPAFRALMLASGARGDMAKVSSIYQRCVAELKEQFGIEPSAETRALYEGLLKGAKVSPRPHAAQPSSTVTFLFTDIEGSTNLLDNLGNQYAAMLETHHKIMRKAIQKWNGKEVDTQGDSFFVTFTRALDAIQCAAEMQRALQSYPWVENKPPRVRMGLHTGEPLIASTGYVGMDVHRAARIGDAAHGGQVLISQTTRELIMHDLPKGMTIRDLGEHRLKDLRFPTPIYQLVIEGLPFDFPPVRTKFTGTEAPTPGEPPFKGLQYFEETDSDLFFGRELLTAKLKDRLRESRFLSVIIGASGSGKSSLARAGLIPALRKDADWEIHVITPTAHPLEALATELTRDSESVTAAVTLMDDLMQDPRSLTLFLARQDQKRHTLLVIDQFEELFTLCRDEFEREAFIDNLLTTLRQSADRFTLVLTLRADFYAHLAQYPELRDAVAKHQEYIGPMSMDELRRAIEEPASRGHWAFEPGLVDLILRDVGDEPGALPLLSHALLETWKRRAGHTLTLKGYADAGGVHGAIAHTAEGVYQSLSSEEQAIARNIFLRLTELGEGTEDTRRRASFDELMSDTETADEVRAVLNMLADARLVTLGEETAEVAHEALIREWPTLREWLNQDREGLQLHRRLTEAAREWEFLERDEGILHRGAQLAQAREWAALHPNALNAAEKAFLEASSGLEQKEKAEREAQRQRELEAAQKLAETQSNAATRLRIRNRVITSVGTIAIILAILAGLLGLRSNQNAIAAETNARTAFARELAASADNTIDVDPELSILLALQGVKVTAPDGVLLTEVENALHRAVLASHIRKTINAHEGPVWELAYSPDGTRLATGGLDGKVHFWDTATYEKIFTIDAHEGGTISVSFSPDGKRIASGGEDGLIRIWNAETQKPLDTFEGHTDSVLSVVYSPDSTQLATLGADNTFRIWDASTGAERARWPLEEFGPLVYSPDGVHILFVTLSNTAINLEIRESAGGEVIHSIPVGERIFALSPDGTRLAVISEDTHFIRVLDASNDQPVYNIKHPSNAIEYMRFSPDGSKLAAVSRDRKVHIWDAETGVEIFTFAGHKEFIGVLAFAPDGKHLASGGYDGTVKIWSLDPDKEIYSYPGGVTRMALSPDGRFLATVGTPLSGLPTLLQVFDIHSRKLMFTEKTNNGAILPVAFSPDSRELALAGIGVPIKLMDPSNGKVRLAIPTLEFVKSMSFSPDGKILVAASDEGKLRMYDRATGKALEEWDPGLGPLSAVKFSPDGMQVGVVSDATNNGKILDVTSGKEVVTLFGHTNSNWNIDFNSDGTRVVTTGRDGTARIWDTMTGELLLTLAGHTSTVAGLDFSPDNTRIATASQDSTVRVWDALTGEELLALERKGVGNSSVLFTPDNKQLIFASNTDLQVIALTIEELVEIAKSRLTRTWTLEECQKYLHMETCPSEQ